MKSSGNLTKVFKETLLIVLFVVMVVVVVIVVVSIIVTMTVTEVILYLTYLALCMCMFLIVGQATWLIQTKLDTWTHFDPGSVFSQVKVGVSENTQRLLRLGVNAIDVRMDLAYFSSLSSTSVSSVFMVLYIYIFKKFFCLHPSLYLLVS